MTKRFIVESVMIDCLCEDEPRIAKVITDTDENYSYEELYEVAELLNEQQATINKLNEENAKLLSERIKDCEEFEECVNKAQSLKKENERLKDYIDTIFEDNTHICNELDIEDVQFYCERNKDYRSPSCLYQKCFNEENLVELSEKIKELFDDE